LGWEGFLSRRRRQNRTRLARARCWYPSQHEPNLSQWASDRPHHPENRATPKLAVPSSGPHPPDPLTSHLSDPFRDGILFCAGPCIGSAWARCTDTCIPLTWAAYLSTCIQARRCRNRHGHDSTCKLRNDRDDQDQLQENQYIAIIQNSSRWAGSRLLVDMSSIEWQCQRIQQFGMPDKHTSPDTSIHAGLSYSYSFQSGWHLGLDGHDEIIGACKRTKSRWISRNRMKRNDTSRCRGDSIANLSSTLSLAHCSSCCLDPGELFWLRVASSSTSRVRPNSIRSLPPPNTTTSLDFCEARQLTRESAVFDAPRSKIRAQEQLHRTADSTQSNGCPPAATASGQTWMT
jgi:hypothetical protein